MIISFGFLVESACVMTDAVIYLGGYNELSISVCLILSIFLTSAIIIGLSTGD